MPIYIYKGNSQISTNAVRNGKAVKAIYAKEQGQDAVCVWGVEVSIPYDQMFTYFVSSDNKVTITGLKPEVKTAYITIPDTLDSKPVSSIADSAFKGKNNIVSITIPNSVTSIGPSAFDQCASLISVTFSKNSQLTTIGSNAFRHCTSLTSIVIPDSVTSFGESVFYGCSYLKSLTVPFVGSSLVTDSSTWQYPLGYFFGTRSYDGGVATEQYLQGETTIAGTSTKYYIPSSLNSVTVTGGTLYGVFYNCKNITNIVIGEGVTAIGSHAFRSCDSLTNIVIPNSVTSIGANAFYNTAWYDNQPDGLVYAGCSEHTKQ